MSMWNSRSRPIRVAQVIGKMVGGGVESVILNYWKEMDKERIQFDFIIDSDSTYIPIDAMQNSGGKVFKVAPYQHQPRNYMQLRELFKAQEYDIVHSHLNTLSIISLKAAYAANIPVRIAHSHSTEGGTECLRNIAKRVLKFGANIYPTHRMACSNYAGEWLFGRKETVYQLYNAINLDCYTYSSKKRELLRRELGIGNDVYVLGFVGRLVPQKNPEFSIKVLEEMISKGKNSVLIIIGQGELQKQIVKRIHSPNLKDKILLLGQRLDANEFYSVFDAMLLPSRYEGLGMVAIEAQRAGLHCYMTDAFPEEARLTSLIHVFPQDALPAEWANTIIKNMAYGRSALKGEEIKNFQKYDITKAAKELMEFYESAHLRGTQEANNAS